MGRRGKKEEKSAPGAPLWMVTYSDMVTLLLTFFVMLIAMASFEKPGRVQAVFQSIRLALGVGGAHEQLMGSSSEVQQQIKEIQSNDQLQPVMSRLRESLSRKVSDDMIRMTRTRTEIRVSLSDSVLFKAGKRELSPAAYPVLTKIAQILADFQKVKVQVEGHTDDTGDTKGNWDLSAGRAVEVVHYLQQKGKLDGQILEAKGYGQFRPAAPEGMEELEHWNRRVELVIQSENPVAYEALYEVERATGGLDGG